MAWETTEWACGHTGEIQLYGPQRQRDSRIASEAGRKCFACWLVEKWEQEGDPRATKPDRYRLAATIAENKNIRIFNLPEDAPASDSREALRAERDKLLARLAEIDAELGKDQKKVEKKLADPLDTTATMR